MHIIQLSDNVFFNLKESAITTNKYDTLTQEQQNILIEKMIVNRKNILNETKKVFKNITLIPTMDCHGQCSYCYNKKNNNLLFEQLNSRLVKQTIDTLKQNKDYSFDVKTISLYGGEPFLNSNIVSILDMLYTECNINKKTCLINISSGLLFDNDVFNNALKQMQQIQEKDMMFYISVSVDLGIPDDKFTRKHPFVNKQILLERLKILNNNNIRTKCNIIISKDTDVDLLQKEICQYIQTHNIQTTKNTSILDPHVIRISSVYDNQYFINNSKIDNIFELIKWFDNQNIPITTNVFPYNDVLITPKIYQLDSNYYIFKYAPFYCGIFHKSLVIMPNGLISHCHMEPYAYGLQKSSEDDIILNNPTCSNCNFFLVCRGVCVNTKKYVTNNHAFDSYCNFIKNSFIYNLKRIYTKCNNDNIFLNMLSKLSENRKNDSWGKLSIMNSYLNK